MSQTKAQLIDNLVQPITGALGSASAPTFSFTSDPNTGIYSPGADQLAISTNGIGRLFVDASGNVGVGASSSTAFGVTASAFPLAAFKSTSASTANSINFLNNADVGLGFITYGSTYAGGSFLSVGASGSALTATNDLAVNGGSTLRLGTAGTERLRITSAGLVGIGTTSPASKLDLVDIAADSILSIRAGSTFSPSIYFEASGSNAGAIKYDRATQALTFSNNSSTTERFRIDSSGRLLVGTSSTSANTTVLFQGTSANVNDGAAIRLAAGAATPADGTNLGYLFFSDSSHTASAGIQAQRDGGTWTTNSSLPSRLTFSTTANGASSPTERMRITSDGRVGIGTSSVYSATRADTYTNNSVWFTHTFRQDEATGYGIGIGSDGTSLALFYPNSALSGAPVGQISHNGSSTTYATSSDYRLKENIAAVTDGITRLQQLKPRRFNFKANPGHTVDGFIAHEAAEVVPECATGAKDEVDADGNPVYQGIDQSKLVPLLTAALQEAVARIKQLEAAVTALQQS